jgi:hypothetical protein
MLSEDEELSWEVDTICAMVQQCMERFWQIQMKLDTLTHPG